MQVVMAALSVAVGGVVALALWMKPKIVEREGAEAPVIPPPKPPAPPPDVTELLRRADEAVSQGDTDSASLLLAQAAALEPGRPGLFFVRSRLVYALGDQQEALRLLHAACQARPEVAAWHGVAGSILMEVGQFEKAAVAFEMVLKLEPENEHARGALKAAQAQLD